MLSVVEDKTPIYGTRKSFIMINDPDKGYITSGPYQLIKQFVIRPGAYLRGCDTTDANQ